MLDCCLHCHQPLESAEEKKQGWHHRCVRAFFSSDKLPDIDLSTANIESFARASIGEKRSISGVQKKISFGFEKSQKGNSQRLTLTNFPTGYILKPPAESYPEMTLSEETTMAMADLCHFRTVPHSLIRLHDGGLAYICKRVDRTKGHSLPMEDFCQLSGKMTSNKYVGSYEQIGKLILQHSSMPGEDLVRLFQIVLFCFLTGNSDMHLKNFSLLGEEASSMRLSPFYDLLPVDLFFQDEEMLALTLDGRKNKISIKHFNAFAETLGLSNKVRDGLIQDLLSKKDLLLKTIQDSLLSSSFKKRYCDLLNTRFTTLLLK